MPRMESTYCGYFVEKNCLPFESARDPNVNDSLPFAFQIWFGKNHYSICPRSASHFHVFFPFLPDAIHRPSNQSSISCIISVLATPSVKVRDFSLAHALCYSAVKKLVAVTSYFSGFVSCINSHIAIKRSE